VEIPDNITLETFTHRFPPQYFISTFAHSVADFQEADFFEAMARDFSFFVTMSLFVSPPEAIDGSPEFRNNVMSKWKKSFLKKNQLTLAQMSELYVANPHLQEQAPVIDIEEYNENVKKALEKFENVFLKELKKQINE
jgi:hypothetical protein